MINLQELKLSTVSDEVSTFMQSHGGSHVALYRGWDLKPEMHGNADALLQQLAWAIQKNRRVIAKRVLGRYRKLRDAEEVKGFDAVFGIMEDCLL